MTATTLGSRAGGGDELPGRLPGGELVELSERLFRRTWIVGARLALAGTLLSGAYLALAPPLGHSRELVATWSLLLAGAVALVMRPEAVYSRVRRRPLEVLVAAGLVGVAYGLIGAAANGLWFATIVPLCIVGTAASRRIAFAAAILIAVGQFTALADPGPSGTATVAGAAAADLVLPVFIVAMIDRLAQFLLVLNVAVNRPVAREAPRWVPDSANDPPRRESSPSSAGPLLLARKQSPAHRSGAAGASSLGLTARQLQAATLLAEGLQHAEIAACLEISIRQARRLTTAARDRAGVRTKSELVALLVEHGLADGRDTESEQHRSGGHTHI